MATATDVFDKVRILLNDRGSAVYTNDVLLGLLNIVWDELAQTLILNGVKLLKETTSTPIEVAANATTLTSPTDMVTPIRLFERPDGSTYKDWKEVTKLDRLDPASQPQDRITEWEWRENAINFIAPTTNREVMLDYWKLPGAYTAGSTILDTAHVPFLTHKTAVLAAATIGQNEQLAGYLNGLADKILLTLLGKSAHSKQSTPVRRRPFRASRGLKRTF